MRLRNGDVIIVLFAARTDGIVRVFHQPKLTRLLADLLFVSAQHTSGVRMRVAALRGLAQRDRDQDAGSAV